MRNLLAILCLLAAPADAATWSGTWSGARGATAIVSFETSPFDRDTWGTVTNLSIDAPGYSLRHAEPIDAFWQMPDAFPPEFRFGDSSGLSFLIQQNLNIEEGYAYETELWLPDGRFFNGPVSPAPIPLPAPVWLLIAGAAALYGARRVHECAVDAPPGAALRDIG